MTLQFFEGNFLFIGVLCLYGFLLASRFQKKENFSKRVLFSLLLILPAIGITFLYQFLSVLVSYDTIPFSLLALGNYLLLFCLFLVSLFLFFDESRWQLMLCGCVSYACQHLTSKVESFLRSIFSLNHLYTDGDAVSTILGLLFQIVIIGLVFIFLYFSIIRKCRKNYSKGAFDYHLFYFSFLTLGVVLIMNLLTEIFSGESNALTYLNYVFSMVCCLFILLLYSYIIENNHLSWEKNTIQQMWKNDRLQYELTKDNIDMINAKCHDLKKKFDLFEEEQKILSKQEIEDLKTEVSMYDASLRTGNAALDTVLTSYRIYCEKRGILFTCMADGHALDFMSSEDIYSLLFNIISNAVEAVMKLPTLEQKVISLVIKKNNGMILVREENYFNGTILIKGDTLQTSKEDKNEHGIGVKSMQILAEKYNGALFFHADKDTFVVIISFPALS